MRSSKPERPLTEPRRRRAWLLIALLAALLPSPVEARHQPLVQSRPTSSAQAATAPPAATDAWALDWLHQHATRLVDQGVAPGIATVFVQEGRIVISRAYGVADLESGEPVSAERTRFPLGSFTKVLTAMAVLQQVEEGRLSLTEPVSTYLDFPVPWEDTGEPITLHDLLTHTAGFGVQHIGIGTRDPNSLEPLRMYVQNRPRRRTFAPGVLYQYSNYGAAVAGLVVAQVTQRPYESYVTERVLGPLGMSRSGFEPIEQADRALPYFCDAGNCREIPFAYGAALPASGLVGTAEDVARLLIALLPAGPLDEPSVIDPLSASQVVEHKFSPAAHRRPDGPTYGMFQFSDDRVLVATAPGWMGGFTTKVVLYPDQSAAFVILANSTDLRGMAHRLRTQIRRRRACPLTPARADSACNPPGRESSAVEQSEVIGSYRKMTFANQGLARLGRLLMAEELVVFETKAGELAARLGNRVRPLRALGQNLFAAPDEPNTLYLSFLDLAGDGRVDHVQLSDVAFERIPGWQRPPVQQAFVTMLALLSTSFLLVWPLLALRRPASPVGASEPGHPRRLFGPRRVVLLLGLACVLQLVSLVGVSYWASEPQSALLAFGIPRTLSLLRWVAFGTLLTLPLLGVSVLEAWNRGYWSVSARTHFSAVALGVGVYGAYSVYLGIIAI